MLLTPEHGQKVSGDIILALQGLSLTDQLSVLISLVFSHIASAHPADADAIVQQVIGAMPEHWRRSKSIFLYGSLPN